ncbi:MAG: hypothetical protein A2201_06635 [Alicyclobacillus sp. RIFOXYA1_FULL_53_8]|nr:MAG: hypothetical protein A2201_06635 [Alicyclobacillus sp. RIFOXYA1_FULL_53_8]
MNEPNLSDWQADVLREVGNIGAGHAAMALSTLLQSEVRMSVTSARICQFDEIPDVIGGAEAVIVAVFLRMSGDLSGNMMFLLSLASAKQLINHLLPGEEAEDFTELEMSALGEVGNILGGSYLNALSLLTSLRLQQSVPAVAIDMAGAVLDIGILMAGEVADSAVLIHTSIWQGTTNIDGHFFLLPDPDSGMPLLQALGNRDE